MSVNPTIPVNASYGIWLRAPSSSGGKDWVGFVTDTAVLSQWGKIGQINQQKVLSSRPSRVDLQKKVDEKLVKGYRLLGEWHPVSGWSHLPAPSQPQPRRQPVPPSPAPPPPQPSEAVAGWLSANDGVWF